LVADSLFAITDKLDRADEHFEVVKKQVCAYFESDVCRCRGEYDPSAHGHSVEQQVGGFPDIRLATVVGEMVHDLRSALDQLAWRLVKEDGGTPNDGTYFPILKDPPTNNQGVRVPLYVSGGVSADARALIEQSQPWWPELIPPINSAYNPLWVLHRMSIIDKHHHIPIQGVTIDHFNFTPPRGTPTFKWTSELMEADHRSAKLRLVPDDPSVNMQGIADVFVVVHEPPRHPNVLTDTLGGALHSIRGIVDEARATCFRS
jgi:hypothetical protein